MSIGLDIGSSAVRAAEIGVRQGRRVLRRYGQVGLPPGYVVDGEIINIPGVSAALRRLWAEAGFTERNVVVGVSGPRVFVRQADVPAMKAEDLRSSLKFDAQELVPIPMEDASFDFSVLDAEEGSDSTDAPKMRILLVAAHRELLRTYLATLKGAGLTASAMDATALSLMRVVPQIAAGPEQRSGIEVLVSIGAEVTTVAVRDHGVPRFIRSLTVGGTKLTTSIASTMHLEFAVAERLKRGYGAEAEPQVKQAKKAMSVELRNVAEDVRATVDFFMAQSSDATIDRLLVTGGAALTEGLVAAIAGSTPTPISRIDPFATLTLGDLGLNQEQLESASATAATAIGLALFHQDSPITRLSVLPNEVAAARHARRITMLAGAGVAGVAALLGFVGAGRMLEIRSAQHQVQSDQRQVAALNAQVVSLQSATAVHGQVATRAGLDVEALQGDIDWVRLIGQLASVMPADLYMTSFSGARTEGPSATTAGPSAGVGTLTFSVKGTGGLPAVTGWIQGLQHDPSVQGTWVTGITATANGGSVNFSSTSNLTGVADSNRAQAVQK